MWRLFFFSLLLFLLSYLWAVFNIRNIGVHVNKTPEHSQVGEWFDEKIIVFNKSRLPKFTITLEENSNLPGNHNIVSLDLPPNGSHTWQARFNCQHRGQYRIGFITVTTTDPFGFFKIRRNFGEEQSILVYPATLELPLFQPEFYNMPGYGSNRWLQREVTPDAARVREYASGDTLSRIHWHSTAHTGKLMVKVFDPDRVSFTSKNIWLILNMHQATQVGIDNETTEEYIITIAASLMKKYIDSGKQVGMIASGDQDYFITPETGDEHLRRVLEVLALMKATGEVPIDELISNKGEHFESNSTIVIITPTVDDRISEITRYLERQGTMVIVILLDSASFGGTFVAASLAKKLILNGTRVYFVRCGQNLARALDNRTLSSPLSYVGGLK